MVELMDSATEETDLIFDIPTLSMILLAEHIRKRRGNGDEVPKVYVDVSDSSRDIIRFMFSTGPDGIRKKITIAPVRNGEGYAISAEARKAIEPKRKGNAVTNLFKLNIGTVTALTSIYEYGAFVTGAYDSLLTVSEVDLRPVLGK